jgi:hypothetical protein
LGVNLYEDFFRGLHFTMGTALAASDNADDVKANARRFLEQGGFLAAGLAFPVLNWSSQRIACTGEPTPEDADSWRLTSDVGLRIAGDIPSAGSQVDTATGNAELANDVEFRTTGLMKVVRFFAHVHTAYVLGLSKPFYTSLGLPEEHRKPFGYSQVTAGLSILDVVQLSISTPAFAPRQLRHNLRGVVSLGLSKKTGSS